MAEGMSSEDAALPERGRVNRVCREMLVHADEGVAYKLQNEEYEFKYGLNRFNRKTARTDHPIVKLVQNEEEERLQLERMQYLEKQKKQAEQDEKVAQQMMQQLSMEEEEQIHMREIKDAEIAKKCQEKEQKRYERRVREKELAKERKKLEKQLAEQTREAEQMMGNYRREGGSREHLDQVEGSNHGADDALLRTDNRVEDLGDFSDFYIKPEGAMDQGQRKELQELQDEELARLLQDQEHKRGARVKQDKQSEIESKDAELARVLQEQEKLKVRKHKHKHKHHSHHEHHHEHQHHQDERGHHHDHQEGHHHERNQRHQDQRGHPHEHSERNQRHQDQRGHHHEHQEGHHHERNQGHQDQRGHHHDPQERSQRHQEERGHHERSHSHDYERDQNHIYQNAPALPARDHPGKQRRGPVSPDRVSNQSSDQRRGPVYYGAGDELSTRGSGPVSPDQVPSRSSDSRRGPVYYGAGDEISTRGAGPVSVSVNRSQLPESRSQQGQLQDYNEPGSPAPPGYETHNRSSHQMSSPGSASSISTGGTPASNNILTAIDPTYNRDRMDTMPQHQAPSPPGSIPRDPSLTLDMPRRMPTEELPDIPHQEADEVIGVGHEDPYCDLDDFAPVPGQKRTSLGKSSKKGSKKDKSCKQQ